LVKLLAFLHVENEKPNRHAVLRHIISVEDFVFVRNVNFQLRVWFQIGTTGCLRMYSSRQSSKVGSFILS
jgi:hypothetical protein